MVATVLSVVAIPDRAVFQVCPQPAPRGVPQVEVSFDIDTNGILNISAADKTTGKSNHITITNDNGRLSKDEIERILREAEQYKAEDEAAASRIQSKNSLEFYAYNLRNSLSDEKLADKFEAGDKAKLETSVNETIDWLDSSQEASKEEYKEKQKELEAIANLIMQKLYGERHVPWCVYWTPLMPTPYR
ncbi:hypothetical protein HWV62_9149 [Athelia sp. TMB]|nr:hypothetical protein HWV62_43303 [Athelia sp. TMB]KAF7975589.1 hypothetical protein HWV62_9149 [Athelia sp. TMB]